MPGWQKRRADWLICGLFGVSLGPDRGRIRIVAHRSRRGLTDGVFLHDTADHRMLQTALALQHGCTVLDVSQSDDPILGQQFFTVYIDYDIGSVLIHETGGGT